MKNNGGARSRRSTGPFQCCHRYSSVHVFLEEDMLLYLLGSSLLMSCSRFCAVLLFVCFCLVYGYRCSLCTPSRSHPSLGCRFLSVCHAHLLLFPVFSVLRFYALSVTLPGSVCTAKDLCCSCRYLSLFAFGCFAPSVSGSGHSLLFVAGQSLYSHRFCLLFASFLSVSALSPALGHQLLVVGRHEPRPDGE